MASPCYLCANLPPGLEPVGLSSYLVDPGPMDAMVRREEDWVKMMQHGDQLLVKYEQLLVKYFPEVARISPTDGQVGRTGQHFVPDTFLSEAQEVLEPEDYPRKKIKHQDIASFNDSVDKVEACERGLMEELRAHFTSTSPDGGSSEEMALVHGAKLIFATRVNPFGELEGFEEKDILLINKTLQYVMKIESKQSLRDKKKVLPQSNLKKFIDSSFSAEMSEGWMHISVVFTESLDMAAICSNCKDFTMVGRADVVPKLRVMIGRLTSQRPNPSTTPMFYRTLFRSIFLGLSTNPGLIVKSKTVEEVFQKIRREKDTESESDTYMVKVQSAPAPDSPNDETANKARNMFASIRKSKGRRFLENHLLPNMPQGIDHSKRGTPEMVARMQESLLQEMQASGDGSTAIDQLNLQLTKLDYYDPNLMAKLEAIKMLKLTFQT